MSDVSGKSQGSDSKLTWGLAEVVDLEVLVREDAESGTSAEALRERDRGLRGRMSAPLSAGGDRRAGLREWLELRRSERYRDQPSPGQSVESVLRGARVVLFILGLIAGNAAVWSFFHGAEVSLADARPVNARWYALVCIGLPFLFSVYGFWVLLGFRALPKLPSGPPILRLLLLEMVMPLAKKALAATSSKMGAERRLHVASLIGALKQRLQSRTGAIGARFFHLVQAFGVAFTLAVLASSWLDREYINRHFGWETSAGTTAESVHSLVKAIAKPWAWLAPEGTGFPSLEQVEKTNHTQFQTPQFPREASTAWATFLIYAALVYGFLPRALLSWLSGLHAAALLRREKFSELRFDPLWERLTYVDMSVSGPARAETLPAPVEVPHSSDEAAAEPPKPVAPAAPPPPAGSGYRLILPTDIEEPGTAEAIGAWLRERKQWEARGVIPLGASVEEREEFLVALKTPAPAAPHLVLVQEDFMPAVEQVRELLTAMRATLGPESKVLIGLLGKPNGTPLARPPQRVQFEVWQKIVTTLGDPNLDVFTFFPPV